ncbi:ABC transporter ATP-binding protein [Desulforamulus aquiferis]|uniref:ABC transporter ATP-binding protein n=1 Tax=Desulforamulus aquiferis TaxID=1397668 RepID=A0AAW7ZGK7_9FIRM|nr:ABC transporter ATP-binding protein [Desulforamulus aquiferis]MDO7788837.1 ABC transporter ATP-binding protein [Desulforamulus aquiferis]
MRDITKRFPGVLSNDNVSIRVESGEILALLGENGAGKTTLMNILYGLYQPEEGDILINGESVKINSPRYAIDLGIGMVHQHFMLVPTLTVSENVALGLEGGRGPFLDLKSVAARIREISSTYGLAVNPEAYVWQLSVGEQQRVEIVKALYRGASLLILDEPTAVLTPQEAQELIGLLRKMAEQGRSIIIISHKLSEVMAVSDRVSVLRDGKHVATVNTSNTCPEELARLMVGRETSVLSRESRTCFGDTVLEVRDLTVTGDKGTPALKGVSLGVQSGEILGIAGVSGNGQKELAEAISGLRRVDRGQIKLKEQEITNLHPKRIIQQGLGYIPEDRLHVGTIGSFYIWENLILKDHHQTPYAKRFFLQNKAIRSRSSELVASYGVKTPNLETSTGRLSGGNIQRLILAREITRKPLVLVAAYPTRGLDIGATEYVHSMLLKAREQGMGVILISEDLEEVTNLSDRIAVFFEGQVMKILPSEEANENNLGMLMAGMDEAAC